MTIFTSIKNKIFQQYHLDSGKMLIHTGAVGWIFSSLAQISVIATDKKIDKKEKKFLVPQEICDGVVNVSLYYTISELIKRSGDYLINNGHLITDDIQAVIMKLKNQDVPVRIAIKGLGESLKNIPGLTAKEKKNPLVVIEKCYQYLEKYNNLPQAERSAVSTQMKEAFANLKTFQKGISVVCAIGASILASNIITPIVRNKMASLYQQKFILNNEPKKQETYKPQALPKAFNNFNISGSMKV